MKGSIVMQCFIYKSLKKQELYLYTNKKDDFSSIPEPLLQSIGKPEYVMELELSPERQLAREDVNKVITALKNTGFFIQMPPVIMPNQVMLKNNKLH